METFFKYYMLTVFAFSFISGILYVIYMALISDYMSAKYHNEHQKFFNSLYWSPGKTWNFLKGKKSYGDDKLNSLRSKAKFWSICFLSIFVTGPAGAFVYLILLAFFG